MSTRKRYPKNFPIPPDPISPDKLKDIITNELPKWEKLHTTLPQNPNQKRTEIFREFLFEDFNQAMEFIIAAQPYFNFIPHHPRMENIWRTVWIYLCTWDVGYTDQGFTITYKDILVARNLEKLYNKEFYTKYDYRKRNIDEEPIDPQKQAFIETLKEKISKGKLVEDFTDLDTYFIRNDRFKKPNDLIEQQDAFITLLRDQDKGILTREQYEVGRARIVNTLLDDLLNVGLLLQH